MTRDSLISKNEYKERERVLDVVGLMKVITHSDLIFVANMLPTICNDKGSYQF